MQFQPQGFCWRVSVVCAFWMVGALRSILLSMLFLFAFLFPSSYKPYYAHLLLICFLTQSKSGPIFTSIHSFLMNLQSMWTSKHSFWNNFMLNQGLKTARIFSVGLLPRCKLKNNILVLCCVFSQEVVSGLLSGQAGCHSHSCKRLGLIYHPDTGIHFIYFYLIGQAYYSEL